MESESDVSSSSGRIDEITTTRTGHTHHQGVSSRQPLARARSVTFDKILVPYDASEGAEDALAWARWIARAHGSTIVLALVLPPTMHTRGGGPIAVSDDAEGTINAILENDLKHGARMVDKTQKRLEDEGYTCETVVTKGRPANELVQLPDLKQADLVIVGPHAKKGIEQALLGSVCNAVAQHAPTNVLVARGPPPVHHSLLAVDGSPLSHHVVSVLLALPPEARNARVVHVLPQPFSGFSPRARELIDNSLPRLQEELERRFELEHLHMEFDVLFGNVAKRILEAADEHNTQLVVMGARGHGRIKSWLLGSVSNQVLHHTNASVLLVREPEQSEPKRPVDVRSSRAG